MKYPFDHLWVYYWLYFYLVVRSCSFSDKYLVNGSEGEISLYDDGVFELFPSVKLRLLLKQIFWHFASIVGHFDEHRG